MPVRKSERRIPSGFSADDLGDAILSSDGQVALVSFYSSPVTQNRQQTYVALVLETALQNQVASYHWQAGEQTADTDTGIWKFTPAEVGNSVISAGLLDGGGTVLRTLT